MSDATTFLVIGLPSAGKTTYLAALWHVAESGDVPDALTIEQLGDHREYIEHIRSAWLRFEPVGRTLSSSRETVTLRVRPAPTSGPHTLQFPDLAGEVFRNQWQFRTWSRTYGDVAQSTRGALVFINPDALVEPTTIRETAAAVVAAGAGSSVESDEVEAWDPAKTATQVQLVELLQFLIHDAHAPLTSVAIVVSAWDVLEDSGLTPESWIARRTPLLWQFGRAHFGPSNFCVYGISAQGGAIDAKAELERLQALESASSRIIVIAPDGSESHDVTLPVRWLIENGSRAK